MRMTSVLVLVFGALALGGCEEKKTEATPEPSAKAAAGDSKKAADDKKDDKKEDGDKKGDKKEDGDKKDKEDDGGW